MSDHDDIATVCAIAAIAICTTTFAHEAMGHGGMCLALGGHITKLTNAYFQCSLKSRFIAPAGPLGNYAAGLVAWLAQKSIPPARPRLKLFALLVMAFSLFWEAGYLVAAMVRDKGDYVFAAQDFIGGPDWRWRVGGIVLGIGLYRIFVRMLANGASSFATEPGRVPRLLRPAWLTAIAVMAFAASFYAPDRLGAMAEAVGAVLSGFPLLYPHRNLTVDPKPAPTIARSWSVIAGGIVVTAGFATILGRGLP